MNIQRFLASAVALVALGLPARANLATYCDSATPSCTNSSAAFSSAGYVPIDFTSAAIVSNSFTDPASGTAFFDYLGGIISESAGMLFDTNSGFQINVPANTLTFAVNFRGTAGNFAVQFNTDSGATFSQFTISADGSSQFFGATSTTPITNLVVYDNNTTNGSIDKFQLQGPANSDTPEVGTLLLIGSGLIAMRWMNRLPRLISRTPRTAQSPA